jgi:DnaK suppressor protein
MPLTGRELEERRSALEQRGESLRREMREVEADREGAAEATREVVADIGEQGEQLSRDAVRGAEEDRDAAELNAIVDALRRIESGSYGDCIDCGEPIPLPRLIAQPTATRCTECQARHEATAATQAPS